MKAPTNGNEKHGAPWHAGGAQCITTPAGSIKELHKARVTAVVTGKGCSGGPYRTEHILKLCEEALPVAYSAQQRPAMQSAALQPFHGASPLPLCALLPLPRPPVPHHPSNEMFTEGAGRHAGTLLDLQIAAHCGAMRQTRYRHEQCRVSASNRICNSLHIHHRVPSGDEVPLQWALGKDFHEEFTLCA